MRKPNKLITWFVLVCLLLNFGACSQGQTPETTLPPAAETTAPAVETTAPALAEPVDFAGDLELNLSSESAKQEVHINEAGYEYTIVYREDSEQITVLWKDEQEICYYLISSLEEQEIIEIMNKINAHKLLVKYWNNF